MELRSLDPQSSRYLLNFLSLGIRTDGRVHDARRSISLKVGSIRTADGSSLLRCGDTVIVCGVKLELVSNPESKSGFLVCNVECGSSCLPEFTSGAPSTKVQALTKQLQLLLNKYVNLEELTVKNSELVWIVHVDVICLSHQGNLLDTCSLATVAALKNTTMPSLSSPVSSTHPKLDSSAAGSRLPLFTPSFTFSFAIVGQWCLLDPSIEEERIAQGHLSISLNSNGSLTLLQHTGHVITEQEILRLSQLAMKQVTTLNELLQTAQLTQ